MGSVRPVALCLAPECCGRRATVSACVAACAAPPRLRGASHATRRWGDGRRACHTGRGGLAAPATWPLGRPRLHFHRRPRMYSSRAAAEYFGVARAERGVPPPLPPPPPAWHDGDGARVSPAGGRRGTPRRRHGGGVGLNGDRLSPAEACGGRWRRAPGPPRRRIFFPRMAPGAAATRSRCRAVHSALMKSRVRFQGICNKAEPYCCSTPLRSERDRK